jgi:uroporphyrinogen-III synthase
MGLDPVVAPLFEVVPVAWAPPDPRRYDAILLTSGNAPRLAGSGLDAFKALPAYAVGEATAEATRTAGFADVRTGPSDGAAALALAAAEGATHILRLCGRDHLPLVRPGLLVDRTVVYAAEAVPALPPQARRAIAEGAIVLVHSPRAARTLAGFVADRSHIRLALISAAAADAAGDGWAAKAVAGAPCDEALLEVARRLCHTIGPDAAGAGS